MVHTGYLTLRVEMKIPLKNHMRKVSWAYLALLFTPDFIICSVVFWMKIVNLSRMRDTFFVAPDVGARTKTKGLHVPRRLKTILKARRWCVKHGFISCCSEIPSSKSATIHQVLKVWIFQWETYETNCVYRIRTDASLCRGASLCCLTRIRCEWNACSPYLRMLVLGDHAVQQHVHILETIQASVLHY